MKPTVKEMIKVHPAFLVLALIFSICFMASGFAAVKAGDYLKFRMTITDPVNGMSVTEIENEVMSYSATDQTYTTKETQTTLLPTPEAPVVTLNTVDADELLSYQDVAQMLKECTSMGGKRVKIQISAGIFQACKLDGELDSIYYAQVPQGLIKSVLVDQETGFRSELTLQAYRYGK